MVETKLVEHPATFTCDDDAGIGPLYYVELIDDMPPPPARL